MKLNNCAIFIGLLAMALQMFSQTTRSEVLELGASELHGKKDQPEAMTFISRAPIEASYPTVAWHARDLIKKEIDSAIFLIRDGE